MNLDLSGISVMLAIPVNRDFPVETVISLTKTVAQLEVNRIDYSVHYQIGSSIIMPARSKCAHSFLESKHDRIFWLDSDVVWEPDSFFRILALSTKLDVVGALYPFKEEPICFGFNFETPRFEADEYGCFPVGGLGMGFVCMRRHVIEKLAEKAPKRRFLGIPNAIPHMFRCDEERMDEDGVADFRGEDIAFCADIRAAGYEVKVDPTITLGHVGQKTYRGRLMDLLKKN